jgi:hypothetical protein
MTPKAEGVEERNAIDSFWAETHPITSSSNFCPKTIDSFCFLKVCLSEDGRMS